jgi:hypothetical protein
MKHIFIDGVLHAIIPIVPTKKMNDAYIEEVFAATDRGNASLDAHLSAYKKMLEAYVNE